MHSRYMLVYMDVALLVWPGWVWHGNGLTWREIKLRKKKKETETEISMYDECKREREEKKDEKSISIKNGKC